MNTTIFYGIFLLLASFYLFLGIYAARGIKTQGDYFLAGRQLGFFAVLLTLLATQIGGGMILGTADDAYAIGLYGAAYTLGMFLGFSIMALGLAGRLRSLQISTTAEIFSTIYQSQWLRKIAALLMVIALAGILIGQVVAIRRFMIGIGVYSDWLFILFWAFIVFYTMMGGLKAVVLIDMCQVGIVIAVFVGIFIVTLFAYPLTEVNWIPSEQALQQANLSWMIILLAPPLFNIIEQDLAQRYFASKSKRIATAAAACAAIFLLLFAIIPTYFGVLANHLEIPIPEGGAVLMAVLQVLSNDFVIVLIATALLAAVISTADSLLCAVSSNLSHDFNLWHEQSEKAVRWSRLITLSCGIIVLVLAYQFDNIIAVLVYSYLIPVSAMTVPIFFALICKKVYPEAAMAAVIVGLITLCAFFFGVASGWYRFNELIPVGLSLIAYVLVWGYKSYQQRSI